MIVYLARHAEPESGEPMDPTRILTPAGERQASDMAAFLRLHIGHVETVLTSNMRRAIDTAQPIARALGATYYEETPTLDPIDPPEKAARRIKQLARNQDCVVVTHDPLTTKLVEYWTGAKTNELHFCHGAIAAVDLDHGFMLWMVTPQIYERDELPVIEAAVKLADAVLNEMGARLDEASGEYTYDLENVKRSVLGDGGVSGNCELCIECSDQGWIPDEDVFDSGEDGPPHHINCTCSLEYKEKRVRVPV